MDRFQLHFVQVPGQYPSLRVVRGIGTVRIIDQVKAYKPGHLVTANDVRALLGVLEGDKASKGF